MSDNQYPTPYHNQDEILIEELEVYAYHGVFPEENEKGQKFYINATLTTETRKAGLNDDLAYSTHYGEVAQLLSEEMQKNTCRLIETVAEHLAEAILLTFPLINNICLEIRKPEAPIPLTFASVSVKIRRGWHKAYIATGANLGDPEHQIRTALQELTAHPAIRNLRASNLYHSTPYGVPDQPDFINGALYIETLLPPGELLEFLQSLEQKAGRKKELRWGARTLDLDILLYDNLITDHPNLTIPHPDLHNRDFVLHPLAELSPYLQHPLLHKTMSQLLSDLDETETHLLTNRP